MGSQESRRLFSLVGIASVNPHTTCVYAFSTCPGKRQTKIYTWYTYCEGDAELTKWTAFAESLWFTFYLYFRASVFLILLITLINKNGIRPY